MTTIASYQDGEHFAKVWNNDGAFVVDNNIDGIGYTETYDDERAALDSFRFKVLDHLSL